MPSSSSNSTGSILIIGASRGLGHAMAEEFFKKGWSVVGTVRASPSRTKLHDLADGSDDRVTIERLDINEPAQLASLRQRLDGRVFDMLFVNERGEVTEGGRSNLFVKLDGRWVTPPLESGVLPGVMRGVLLDDRAFGATERVVTGDDLARAEALLLTNALRGALDAVLK